MAYCTLADLTAQYGERMLVEATDRGGAGTGEVDAAAIEAAIGAADAVIDGYLLGRYRLPLASTPPIVRELSMTITLYKAHPNVASEKVRRDYEDALKQLDRIAAGTIRLAIDGVEPEGAATSGARITETERPMTAANLKGFY